MVKLMVKGYHVCSATIKRKYVWEKYAVSKHRRKDRKNGKVCRIENLAFLCEGTGSGNDWVKLAGQVPEDVGEDCARHFINYRASSQSQPGGTRSDT